MEILRCRDEGGEGGVIVTDIFAKSQVEGAKRGEGDGEPLEAAGSVSASPTAQVATVSTRCNSVMNRENI